MNDKEIKVKEKLVDQPEKNLIEFFENEKNNKYVDFIINKIDSDGFNLKEVIEYGLSKVTDNKEEQMLLSSYFFTLSDLKGLDEDIRDFILDISIWCEGAFDYSQYFKDFEPLNIYEEKIKLILEEV